MGKASVLEIRPQVGPQEEFLKASADIVIYGGSAGSGKSWAVLMEAVRHVGNGKFGAVIFRQTYPQITEEGGLWDTSEEIYPLIGGRPNKGKLEWVFPSGCRVSFAHLGGDRDLQKYMGSQMALIVFDELTHFSEKSFFYLLSRNRSMSGVRPYIRATCNPDSGHWLVRGRGADGKSSWGNGFISWWIDPDTGYPIKERSNIARWFIRSGNDIYWDDTKAGLISRFPDLIPRSATFICASVADNQKLLDINPEYIANLQALHPVDRERLLLGNWKISEEAGTLFRRGWFKVCENEFFLSAKASADSYEECRFWDFAATEHEVVSGQRRSEPCSTAGVKITKIVVNKEAYYFVSGAVEEQWNPAKTNDLVKNIAAQDGAFTKVRWEIEPGSMAIRDTYALTKMLKGYNAMGMAPETNKLMRAKPFATAASNGQVIIVRGFLDAERFISSCVRFPGVKDGKDIVDAASGAFAVVSDTPGVYRETKARWNR